MLFLLVFLFGDYNSGTGWCFGWIPSMVVSSRPTSSQRTSSTNRGGNLETFHRQSSASSLKGASCYGINKKFDDPEDDGAKQLWSRRRAVMSIILSGPALLFQQEIASAAEEKESTWDTTTTTNNNNNNDNRPFAPTVEPLIPAMLVYQILQRALKLANEWNAAIAVGEDPPEQYAIQTKLQALFDKPSDAPYPRRVTRISRKSLYALEDRDKVEQWWASSQSNTTFATAALSGRLVRSCCNVYTANLRFNGQQYLLTADPATRKELIRSEALPSVQNVVTSDLDLRDLYRNQLQTCVEDLQAELYSKDVDPIEVQALIQTSLQAMDQWLSLIRQADIQQAQQVLNQMITSSSSSSVPPLKLPNVEALTSL